MKEFKVAAVSSNANAFGLRSMVVIAKDGEAWRLLASSFYLKKVGDIIRTSWTRDATKFGNEYEVPEQLTYAPSGVVKEVWEKGYKGVPRMLFNMKKRDNPAANCVTCGGGLVPMGQLGNLKWFRCRNCGMEQSRKVRTRRKAVKKNVRMNSSDYLVYKFASSLDIAMSIIGELKRQGIEAFWGYRGGRVAVTVSKDDLKKLRSMEMFSRRSPSMRMKNPKRSRRNPIESVGGGHMITGQSVQLYRLLALKHAMSLELKTGMKMSRGVNPFKIVKQEFGFKGNKQKIYDQLVAHIEQVGPGLAQKNPVYRSRKSGKYVGRSAGRHHKKLMQYKRYGRVLRGWKNPSDPFRGICYWNVWRWNKTFGRKEFIAKVKARHSEIKKYFPGAPCSRLDKMVGQVVVMKKSQARIPAKVKK